MTAASQTAPDPFRTRSRWTRLLVFGGGSLCGLLFDGEALFDALLHRPYHYGTHTAAALFGSLCGDFVLPLAITLIAPRRPLLWAAAALGVGLAWSLLDRVAALNFPGFLHDLQGNGVAALLALIFICAPVSLLRLLFPRPASGLPPFQAAPPRTGDPGVWPPPIRPEGYPEDR